jgi:hypothetical protein
MARPREDPHAVVPYNECVTTKAKVLVIDMSKRRAKSTAENMRLCDEAVLARLATIFGPQSASAGALNDIALRRARGERPVCVDVGGLYLVFDASDDKITVPGVTTASVTIDATPSPTEEIR